MNNDDSYKSITESGSDDPDIILKNHCREFLWNTEKLTPEKRIKVRDKWIGDQLYTLNLFKINYNNYNEQSYLDMLAKLQQEDRK